MSLKNIIGQKKAIGILFEIIKRQKIATSYLFCGEPGIGKKTSAINFAKALNCQRTDFSLYSNNSPGASLETGSEGGFDACDVCESCIKIEAGNHPDFLLIVPVERQIRIEEIRRIDEALSFKPFEGRKKIVVIDDADTMNISSANAFLKTLEEPPEDSVITLISSKPDRLPDTLRSRCSRINFTPLSPESCKAVLEGNIAEKSLEFISRLSMGRPGIALCGDLMEEKIWFLNLFKSMLNAEKDSWSSREDMELWFEHVLTFLRDMAVLKITGDASKLIHLDLHEYLNKLANSVDLKVIIYIYNELNLLKGLLMFNLNKSITWNYASSILRKELTI
jgi:DNA polymerase-3 subunit delta'